MPDKIPVVGEVYDMHEHSCLSGDFADAVQITDVYKVEGIGKSFDKVAFITLGDDSEYARISPFRLSLKRFHENYRRRLKSHDLLYAFTQYCRANPDLRFWQALLNWISIKRPHATRILLEIEGRDGEVITEDTYYWAGEDHNG